MPGSVTDRSKDAPWSLRTVNAGARHRWVAGDSGLVPSVLDRHLDRGVVEIVARDLDPLRLQAHRHVRLARHRRDLLVHRRLAVIELIPGTVKSNVFHWATSDPRVVTRVTREALQNSLCRCVAEALVCGEVAEALVSGEEDEPK